MNIIFQHKFIVVHIFIYKYSSKLSDLASKILIKPAIFI